MTAYVPDVPGVQTEADVPLGGGKSMRVALMLPDGKPPAGGWPGVVVLHEINGLKPHIREVGKTFAARGWAAAVPDYFSAGLRPACLVRAVAEVQSHRPGPLAQQLAAVAGWLGERPGVDSERLASIGFCLGGSFALLVGAVDGAGLKAISVNYGDVPDEETIAKLPPVVGAYGRNDKIFGPKAKVLQSRLTACGVANDIQAYPDAGHGFLTDGATVPLKVAWAPIGGYGLVQSAADPAWERIFAFLEEHTAKP